MSKVTLLSLLAAVAAASTSFAAITYNTTASAGTVTTDTTTPPTALDDINFAASTTFPQELSALVFGIGILPGTTAEVGRIFVDFYDTVNMASTGTVKSNYIGGFGGTYNIAANSGTTPTFTAYNFTGLTTLSTPIIFDKNNIGIVITLTDSTGQFDSTVVTPLMVSPGVPTVGTSVTGVYRDTSNDGDFQATEFNAADGNLYLRLTTVAAPVPEPSSLALLGGASVLGGSFYLRRRAGNS